MSQQLYYAPGACSFVPHALLEIAGVPFEAKMVKLHKGEQSTPEYMAIGPFVEGAFDFQAGFGRGAADQLDDGRTAFERLSAPVLRDVAEQPMLDLVPLRGSRRIVQHLDRDPGFVGEFLQLHFPKPDACAFGAAAVGCDGQLTHQWLSAS